MIGQLHIPVTNSTGGTKKKHPLEKQADGFQKSQLEELHHILPHFDNKKRKLQHN